MGRVSFEFQHNVCGRSIYAEGTIDAIIFLAKKVKMVQYLSYFSFDSMVSNCGWLHDHYVTVTAATCVNLFLLLLLQPIYLM